MVNCGRGMFFSSPLLNWVKYIFFEYAQPLVWFIYKVDMVSSQLLLAALGELRV
jgi:hypothetical protein